MRMLKEKARGIMAWEKAKLEANGDDLDWIIVRMLAEGAMEFVATEAGCPADVAWRMARSFGEQIQREFGFVPCVMAR